MTFSTLFGFGVTLGMSGAVQAIFKKHGKSSMADTLHGLTHVGALSYAVYFSAKLLQVMVQAFL